MWKISYMLEHLHALSPARVGYAEQEEKGTDQEIKKDVTKHQETTYASTVKTVSERKWGHRIKVMTEQQIVQSNNLYSMI